MRTAPVRGWFAAAAAVLLLLSTLPLPQARAAEAPAVTVACIDYVDFLTQEPDGSYGGFGAEYLRRIAAYTGWRYQFVEMDWPTAYEAVRTGAVDFYCVARQTEARQTEFDFSLYPVCNEEMNLYTLPESAAYYEDYASFDGMRIGMLQNSGEIDYFRQYARERGFAYELKEYPLNEDAVRALYKGEVDAIALVNYSVSGGLKLVGNFGVSPAYMMSREGSPYMAQFSEAQERLYFDDPTYAQELETRYFGD